MKEKVIEIIQEVYAQTSESPITDDTDLINDLGFSSLEMLILISELKNQFEIILSPEIFSNSHTVKTIYNVINEIKNSEL